MSATYNLFVRWRNLKGFKSDNQESLALGLPRQTVQNWKEGRNGQKGSYQGAVLESVPRTLYTSFRLKDHSPLINAE